MNRVVGIAARLVSWVAVAWVMAGDPIASRPPQPTVERALDEYRLGNHNAAVRSIEAATTSIETFLAEVDRWIASKGATQEGRRIATAFALDVVWHTTERADVVYAAPTAWRRSLFEVGTHLNQLGVRLPMVFWGSQILKDTAPGTELERWWWLASVGALQGARGWDALLGGGDLPGSVRITKDSPLRSALREGLLADAQTRLQSEPRLKLARSVSLLGRGLGFSRPWPDVRPGGLRDFPHPRATALYQAEQRFNGLLSEPSLAADVQLQRAYIAVRRRRWGDALGQIDSVLGMQPDIFLRSVAAHLRGWVLERVGRTNDAALAYREALALAPESRSTATLLAALLFFDNKRSEAHALLDAATRIDVETDLVARFELGDAYMVPYYLGRMRASLR